MTIFGLNKSHKFVKLNAYIYAIGMIHYFERRKMSHVFKF